MAYEAVSEGVYKVDGDGDRDPDDIKKKLQINRENLG